MLLDAEEYCEFEAYCGGGGKEEGEEKEDVLLANCDRMRLRAVGFGVETGNGAAASNAAEIARTVVVVLEAVVEAGIVAV